MIEEVHELGIHTIVLGFKNTISDIKSIADDFIDIDSIKDKIMMPRKVFAGIENGSIVKENSEKLDQKDKDNFKQEIPKKPQRKENKKPDFDYQEDEYYKYYINQIWY